jgi:hypothetical protein
MHKRGLYSCRLGGDATFSRVGQRYDKGNATAAMLTGAIAEETEQFAGASGSGKDCKCGNAHYDAARRRNQLGTNVEIYDVLCVCVVCLHGCRWVG